MEYSPERKSSVLKRMLLLNNVAIRQLTQGNSPIFNGVRLVELTRPFLVSERVLFRRLQYLGGHFCKSIAIVCLLYVFNDVLVQPFMPDRAVIALDVSVTPKSSWPRSAQPADPQSLRCRHSRTDCNAAGVRT